MDYKFKEQAGGDGRSSPSPRGPKAGAKAPRGAKAGHVDKDKEREKEKDKEKELDPAAVAAAAAAAAAAERERAMQQEYNQSIILKCIVQLEMIQVPWRREVGRGRGGGSQGLNFIADAAGVAYFSSWSLFC